jgi:hypothetical protein
MIFALVSETKLVSASELYRMSKALEAAARNFDQAYMNDDGTRVVVIDKDALLPDGCFPIVFVEDGSKPGTLGEHWFDSRRNIPTARVLVENTTGLNSGQHSASETASHEMHEARANPKLGTWFRHPTRLDVEVPHEPCDPTQDHYVVRIGNTDWNVSNFISSHWYRADLVGRPEELAAIERDFGFGLDWCKRLRTPGEIGEAGYSVMREAANPKRRWLEDMVGTLNQNSRKMDRKQHRSSRTQRLLAGA